jgi:hypothetical protein
MCALTLLVFDPPVLARWRKFPLVVALLQFPLALYELLVLVMRRWRPCRPPPPTWWPAPLAPICSGSPNSVMVIYLFAAMAFLVSRWRIGAVSLGQVVADGRHLLAAAGHGRNQDCSGDAAAGGSEPAARRPDEGAGALPASLDRRGGADHLIVLPVRVVTGAQLLQEVYDSTMLYNSGSQAIRKGKA